MKKFLTVLLALSVVFTYSFSSVGAVFAETLTAEQYAHGKIEAKATEVKVDAAKYDYEASAVDYAIKEATTAGYNAVKVLLDRYDIGLDTEDLDGFYVAVDAWCDDIENNGDVTDGTATYPEFNDIFNEKVVEKDMELKIDKAVKFVENIKPADYIDEDQATVVQYKSKTIETLKAIKETGNQIKNLWTEGAAAEFGPGGALASGIDYKNAINIYLYGATGGWWTVFTADSTMKEIKAGMEQAGSVIGLVYALDELTTLAEDAENSEVTDAYIENIIANITYNAKAASDGFYATHKVTAGDAVTQKDGYVELKDGAKVYDIKVVKASKITAAEATAINNALMAQINDALAVIEVFIKEIPKQFKDGDFGVSTAKDYLGAQVVFYANGSNFSGAMDKALTAKAKYEEVVAYGEDMKDEVNYIGEKMYDDADIDKAVAEAKAKIFYRYYNNPCTEAASEFFDVNPIHDPVEVAMTAAIDKWQDRIVVSGADKTPEADKKYCANYYAGTTTTAPSSVDWQEEYADIRDAAIKALKEVKTIAEVDAIMADADAKLAELRTAAADNSTLKTEVDKYVKALEKYAAEQWELVKPEEKYREASYTDTTDADTTSALEAGMDVINGVATVDALDAAYAKAKALFKDIKTEEALIAEANAVNEAAAKLSGTVKLENEKAYMDANDAFEAYLENYGAKKSDVIGAYASLNTLMKTLKKLQVEAVEEAIKDLAALKPIKADDKAAVQAVRDMYDRYVEYYDNYDEDFDVSNIGDLVGTATTGGYEDDVYLDEIKVVKDMISKLTDASTIAEVTAAKEAYDALSGSQQRAVAKAYPYKVQMLKDRIIAAVRAFQISTTTELVKGKKMIVKWNVMKGDETAIDGYRVYYSTKKSNAGFKVLADVKGKKLNHTSIKNNKNIKKGTRVYYRVKAYKMIDGLRYLSSYSSAGHRTWK